MIPIVNTLKLRVINKVIEHLAKSLQTGSALEESLVKQ